MCVLEGEAELWYVVFFFLKKITHKKTLFFFCPKQPSCLKPSSTYYRNGLSCGSPELWLEYFWFPGKAI